MTDHHQFPAPTANSNSMAAGAGVSFGLYQQVTARLAELLGTVDQFTAHAAALAATPLSEITAAVANVAQAADTVHSASAAVTASLGMPQGMFHAAQAASAAHSAVTSAPGIPQASPPVPPPQPTAPTGSAAPGFFQTTGPWIAGNLYTVIPSAPLSPVADHGEKWFSVTRGKYVGLTKNSAISLNAVTGVSTGLMEKFSTQTDAINNFNAALHSGVVAIL
ncbi:hypothetical protein B0H13DRAFT_1910767 [Mycena leptocephala]|nr:hypothetical protein B0H13DRAFT_1910767 [Mycena leptocephala]